MKIKLVQLAGLPDEVFNQVSKLVDEAYQEGYNDGRKTVWNPCTRPHYPSYYPGYVYSGTTVSSSSEPTGVAQ